jgi:hypothetical protein
MRATTNVSFGALFHVAWTRVSLLANQPSSFLATSSRGGSSVISLATVFG